MCDDVPVQKPRKKDVWGMRTLKMCFGKGRSKRRESVDQGKHFAFVSATSFVGTRVLRFVYCALRLISRDVASNIVRLEKRLSPYAQYVI